MSYPCSQNQRQLTGLAVEAPLDSPRSPHVFNSQEARGRRGVSECPGARKMPPSARGGKGNESPSRVPGCLVPCGGEALGWGEVGSDAPARSGRSWFCRMTQRAASRSTRSPWISGGAFLPPCSSGSGGKRGTVWVMGKAKQSSHALSSSALEPHQASSPKMLFFI